MRYKADLEQALRNVTELQQQIAYLVRVQEEIEEELTKIREKQ